MNHLKSLDLNMNDKCNPILKKRKALILSYKSSVEIFEVV